MDGYRVGVVARQMEWVFWRAPIIITEHCPIDHPEPPAESATSP